MSVTPCDKKTENGTGFSSEKNLCSSRIRECAKCLINLLTGQIHLYRGADLTASVTS